jgi:hypothetical protein
MRAVTNAIENHLCPTPFSQTRMESCALAIGKSKYLAYRRDSDILISWRKGHQVIIPPVHLQE